MYNFRIIALSHHTNVMPGTDENLYLSFLSFQLFLWLPVRTLLLLSQLRTFPQWPNQTALNTFLVRWHLTVIKQVSKKYERDVCFISCLSDNEMQKLLDIITSTDVQVPNEHPSTSTSWCLRQSAAQDEWRKERSYHLNCLLSCNVVPEMNCSHCTSPAIIRCRDCMLEEWLCMDCDIHIHKRLTLHNRKSCIEGIYKPIEPTVCCVKEDGRYTLATQGSAVIFFGTFFFFSLITILIGHIFFKPSY